MTRKIKESSTITTGDLKGIDGLGPVSAPKLINEGIKTPLDIVIIGANEVASITGMDIGKASKVVENVQHMLEESKVIPKTSGWEDIDKHRSNIFNIPSGCKALDEMLHGGIESQAITGVFGEDGIGKTKYVGCVIVEAISKGIPTYLIDCEAKITKKDLLAVAQARGYTFTDETWKLLHVDICLDGGRTERAIKTIIQKIKDFGIKLVVVDGIVGVFRFEYDQGRGDLAPRQNRLKPTLRYLMGTSFYFNLAVVITEQVMSNPDMKFGGLPIKPVGGNIVGHCLKYRIAMLGSKNKNHRVAWLYKSTGDPVYHTEFYITNAGVSDTETIPKKREQPRNTIGVDERITHITNPKIPNDEMDTSLLQE